jgi:hypothetical protein
MTGLEEIEFMLEPLAQTVEKSSPEDPEILKTAFGKRNRIIISRPRLRRFEPKEFGLAPKSAERQQRPGCELVTASTTVSFVPDFGCRFVGGEVSISFSNGTDSLPVRDRPTIIDLRPREAVRSENYKLQSKSSAKVTGSISPGFAKFLGELSETKSLQVGGKATVRDIYAFGLNGSEAGWRFQASMGHDLSGMYENLAFAVRRPVGGKLFGEVRLAAEIAVESTLDRWATVVCGLRQKRSDEGRRFELFTE